MPDEIRNAQLVASELKLEIHTPIRVRGATDQVYQTTDGTVVLVENKRSIHQSGIAAFSLQLGLYRLMLEHAVDSPVRGARFASHGWIYITGDDAYSGHYLRVMLPTDNEIIEAYQRYLALRSGSEPRARTRDPGYCDRICPHHRVRCSGPFA